MLKVIYSNQEDQRKNYLEFQCLGELLEHINEEIDNFNGSDELKVRIRAKRNMSDQITFYDEGFGNHHAWTIISDLETTKDTSKYVAENFSDQYCGEEGLLKLEDQLSSNNYFIEIEDGQVPVTKTHYEFIINPYY